MVQGCYSPRFLAAVLLAASPAALAGAEARRLPAGTAIPVTFETTVSSATSNAEDKVLAKVRQDVSAGGRVVLPAGSRWRVRLLKPLDLD